MLEVQELQQGRRDSEREILIAITESVLNRDFCGLNNIVRMVIGGVYMCPFNKRLLYSYFCSVTGREAHLKQCVKNM